jgi:hypothetical protein
VVGVRGVASSTSAQAAGVRGEAIGTTGIVTGVHGTTSSPAGRGVYAQGGEYAVLAETDRVGGTGVRGYASATSGNTCGVFGRADSPDGYGVRAVGRLRSSGRTFLGTPATAPTDVDLDQEMISFYLDEATNTLKVRVRYSNGTLKTGSIALA